MFRHDAKKGGERKRWVVEAKRPVSFFVQFSEPLFDPENADLCRAGVRTKNARRFLVVDEKVNELHGSSITNFFKKHRIPFTMMTIGSGEQKKDLNATLAILKAMEDFKLEREGEPVIAIGGGVLLDIAGFAASVYRRGVPYIRVPTTLLALVDASVGVKTGINHFSRRNRLGAYHAPLGAFLDRSFLRSLPEKELSNATGEIIKMAVIKDRELFDLLEAHGPRLIKDKFQKSKEGLEIMHRSIHGMVEDLAPNLWESNMRRLVNFGHTWSPLVEMIALPELSHGEAVALDVLFSCLLACERKLMKQGDVARVFKTAKGLGLPTYHPLFADQKILSEGLSDTVRHRNGAQELPLPHGIGSAGFYNDITPSEIRHVSAAMKTYA